MVALVQCVIHEVRAVEFKVSDQYMCKVSCLDRGYTYSGTSEGRSGVCCSDDVFKSTAGNKRCQSGGYTVTMPDEDASESLKQVTYYACP